MWRSTQRKPLQTVSSRAATLPPESLFEQQSLGNVVSIINGSNRESSYWRVTNLGHCIATSWSLPVAVRWPVLPRGSAG